MPITLPNDEDLTPENVSHFLLLIAAGLVAIDHHDRLVFLNGVSSAHRDSVGIPPARAESLRRLLRLMDETVEYVFEQVEKQTESESP